MAHDHELVPKALHRERRAEGLEEPLGAGRRDRPAELDHARDERARSSSTSTARHVFDLNVEYFIGMPSWVAAGDPPYGIWMTHTPQGSIHDNLSGVGAARARELLVLRRLDPPLHPLRHARRHAQPPRPPRHVLERLDGRQGSRQPDLERRAASTSTRRSSRAACCSTSPGCTASTACPSGLRHHAEGPPGQRRQAGCRAAQEGRRARAHRPDDAPGPTSTAIC